LFAQRIMFSNYRTLSMKAFSLLRVLCGFTLCTISRCIDLMPLDVF